MKFLVYKKLKKGQIQQYKQTDDTHYSFAIPSKNIEDYSLYGDFDSIEKLNEFITEQHSVVVAAFSFSDSARQEIEKAKGKCITIKELIKQNPKGKDVRIIG